MPIDFNGSLERIDDPVFADTGKRVVVEFLGGLDIIAENGEDLDDEVGQLAGFEICRGLAPRHYQVRNPALDFAIRLWRPWNEHGYSKNYGTVAYFLNCIFQKPVEFSGYLLMGNAWRWQKYRSPFDHLPTPLVG